MAVPKLMLFALRLDRSFERSGRWRVGVGFHPWTGLDAIGGFRRIPSDSFRRGTAVAVYGRMDRSHDRTLLPQLGFGPSTFRETLRFLRLLGKFAPPARFHVYYALG